MNPKFESMLQNYINENYKEFRAALQKLSKIELLRFCCFCESFYENEIDIFEIEKQFNN